MTARSKLGAKNVSILGLKYRSGCLCKLKPIFESNQLMTPLWKSKGRVI